MQSRSFKKYIYLIFWISLIVLGCFLIPIYLPGFNGKPEPSEPSVHNKPIGMISKGKLFIQEHTAKMDYINSVEILLATWARNNDSYNHLAILDTDFNVLESKRFSSTGVKDNSFYLINFPKDIYVGKGNTVFLCIYSGDGEDNNSITAWSDTNSNKGNLYLIEKFNGNLPESVKGEKALLKGSIVYNTFESDRNNYLFRVLFLILFLVLISPLVVRLKSPSDCSLITSANDKFIILLFMVWIIIPGLYFFILKDNNVNFSRREMRKLAPKPNINFDEIFAFPEKYESFYNDHFPGREKLIIRNSYINYRIFKRSLFPTKVLLGKDGWTFRPSERQILEHKWFLTDVEIHDIVKILHDRTEYYNNKGITFYIAPVPLKSDIYRENLPDYYNLSGQENILDVFMKTLKDDELLKIIDLKPTLIRAKDEGRVFFKTDFHWSEFGGYIAYYEIIKRIRQDFPKVKPIEPNEFEMTSVGTPSGNDAIEIGLEGIITESCFQYHIFNPKSKDMPLRGYKAPEGFGVEKEFYELVRSNRDTSLPKIVVIRDSFYHFLVPLTGESFSTSVFIWDAWAYGLNKEIIENEKPDIVLLVPYFGRLHNVLAAKGELSN